MDHQVWWSEVLGFMHRPAKMPEDSLHAGIPKDNIQNAEHSLVVTNWACGIRKHIANLGMASPFSVVSLGRLMSWAVIEQSMLSQEMSAWQGLHMSLQIGPSACARLEAVHLCPLMCSAR